MPEKKHLRNNIQLKKEIQLEILILKKLGVGTNLHKKLYED